MPLLTPPLPGHPGVGHLRPEDRQLREATHGRHLALQAVELRELQGLGLGGGLLGEEAAMNPLVWSLRGLVGGEQHLPLFARFVPAHPWHLAGEVGVHGLRLLEDALFHQLGSEGLGCLERRHVGFGLGEPSS